MAGKLPLIVSKITVIGTGRRKNKLDDLKNELGDNFMPLCFDIGDMSATKTALQTLPNDILTGIDVLINNAGLALGLESADKANMNDWQAMINTNTLGLVNITREILPSIFHQQQAIIRILGRMSMGRARHLLRSLA